MKNFIKKKLLSRLRRIEGQVRGIERLVETDTYCIDIIAQAQAVKSALSSFENAMLKNHLETHVIEQIKSGQAQKAVKEILKVHSVSQKK
jgi:DNA-binding FrmR family transcriptional regulator